MLVSMQLVVTCCKSCIPSISEFSPFPAVLCPAYVNFFNEKLWMLVSWNCFLCSKQTYQVWAQGLWKGYKTISMPNLVCFHCLRFLCVSAPTTVLCRLVLPMNLDFPKPVFIWHHLLSEIIEIRLFLYLCIPMYKTLWQKSQPWRQWYAVWD